MRGAVCATCFLLGLLAIESVRAVMDEGCAQWGRRNKNLISPRALKVVELLWSWRRRHDLAAIYRESNSSDYRKLLCSRSWIAHDQFDLSCNLAGNHFGSAASALMAAVILDRTMIFRDDESVWNSCDNSIYLKPWVITRAVLEPILERAGCNLFKSKEDYFHRLPNFVPSNPSSNEGPEAGVSRRCGYARSRQKVLIYDDLFNSALELFNTNEFLSADATARTKLLFSNNNPGLVRFEPYGLIIRSFIGFSNKTIALAKNALKGLTVSHELHECHGTLQFAADQNLFTIGMHLRHKRTDEQLNLLYDKITERGLLQLKAKHDSVKAGMSSRPSKCLILLATDRPEAIERVKAFTSNISAENGVRFDCTVRFIERDMSAQVTEKQRQEHYEETGPWASSPSISMADWYLLTHSDSVLLTADSTFSFLIADLVAARAGLKYESASPLAPKITENSFLWAYPPPNVTIQPFWNAFKPLILGVKIQPSVVVMEQIIYQQQLNNKDCPLKGL